MIPNTKTHYRVVSARDLGYAICVKTHASAILVHIRDASIIHVAMVGCICLECKKRSEVDTDVSFYRIPAVRRDRGEKSLSYLYGEETVSWQQFPGKTSMLTACHRVGFVRDTLFQASQLIYMIVRILIGYQPSISVILSV